MPDRPMSHDAALLVIQQAVLILVQWADPTFTYPCSTQSAAEDVRQAVSKARRILKWADESNLTPLQLVFERIHLSHNPTPLQYRPAWKLEASCRGTLQIPYASCERPSLDDLKACIAQEFPLLDWRNLSQLTVFLEKFASHISYGEPDIALLDLARTTAALAAALAQSPKNDQLALVAGDFTGVQKFIYTISSDGALKSLRARSFYLDLVTEELVQQLLDALNLPRTNIIYSGASKFYLLTAATETLEQTVRQIQMSFNTWLLREFQRKVFLAMGVETFPASELEEVNSQATHTPLAQRWQAVNKHMMAQASRKFEQQLDEVLDRRKSHDPCKVCHRDDTDKLQRLNQHEPDSVLACKTCRIMFQLGDQLPEVVALVRSLQPYNNFFKIKIQSSYYHLCPTEHSYTAIPQPNVTLLINNWHWQDYASNQFTPLLLSNYFQKSSTTGGFLSAGEMAEAAEKSGCIPRVGYLRMDVDRLSQIFSIGLGRWQTLPRLASLSRQMTYFFKVYLKSLAAERDLPSGSQQRNPSDRRPNLLFIYAGGDDLFVSGAWNEIVDFAFDVYQAFRAYTGHHPNITLSAGISIVDVKFPLYQAANQAGDFEKDAKRNARDSLSLFGQVFKWSEWSGAQAETILKSEDRQYLHSIESPSLFGVLPFVIRLTPQLDINLSRSFIQNLLLTAQVQRQMLERIKNAALNQQQDTRYFLHLPRIAYTLTQLPRAVKEHQDFEKIRTSLKNPRNAPYFGAIATWIELLTRTSKS